MGTQTALAAQIYNASADYVLALKANHPTLHGQVEAWFEQAQALNFEGLILATTNGWKREIIVLKKASLDCACCSITSLTSTS